MIESEIAPTYQTSMLENDSSTILITGFAGAAQLATQLQGDGLDCRYMDLPFESDSSSGNFTYQQLAPVLAQAQQLDIQLVIVAQPEEHKLTLGIRKQPNAPFQLLSVHQLAALLADTLSDEAEEQQLVCLRSVVMTNMLDTILHKKGFICKTEVRGAESIADAGLALQAETGAAQVLAVSEKGEFWSNQGIPYLVAQLINLHADLASREQTLYDRLLELYCRYGLYKDKVLTVTLSGTNQEEHYQGLMNYFRTSKSAEVASYSIKEVVDYKRNKLTNFMNGKQIKLDTPPVDMLRVVFTDGISLTFVPERGKMNLYLSLSGKLMNKQGFQALSQNFDQRLMKLVELVNKL